MCGLSLIIAPCCICVHRSSKRYPKRPGFCPGIAGFANMRTFWRKTKVIFGISSSNCIESYITVSVSGEKSQFLCSIRFWRDTGISPIRLSPIGLSPMAKVHRTFANTSPGISPIGESPLYFRQYTPGLSPLANVLLAKVLLANVPPPVLKSSFFVFF